MVDPTTVMIGAAVGGLTSAAMGKNPFTGALLGGAGAGMLGSMGGAAAGETAGTTAATTSGAVSNATYGNPEFISPFTQSGISGGVTNTMGGLPPLMDPQTAGMYSGSQGMFDTMGGAVSPQGVSNAIMTDVPVVATGGGYSDNILNKIGVGEYNLGNMYDALAENPKAAATGVLAGVQTPDTPNMPIQEPTMTGFNTANRVTAYEPDMGGFDKSAKGQFSDTLLARTQKKEMPYSLYNKSLLG